MSDNLTASEARLKLIMADLASSCAHVLLALEDLEEKGDAIDSFAKEKAEIFAYEFVKLNDAIEERRMEDALVHMRSAVGSMIAFDLAPHIKEIRKSGPQGGRPQPDHIEKLLSRFEELHQEGSLKVREIHERILHEFRKPDGSPLYANTESLRSVLRGARRGASSEELDLRQRVAEKVEQWTPKG